MSSEASRNSRVVRRDGMPTARCSCSEPKNDPVRTSTTAATGWSRPWTLVDQPHHVVDQLGREVVDDEVSEVLELLGRRAPARAGHAGHDDQLPQ
jgi:hypothetical protein